MRFAFSQLLGKMFQVRELINARVSKYPSPVCNPLLLAVAFEADAITEGMPYKGHDLQQYYQLVADLGASDRESESEFIGFFDTDVAIIRLFFQVLFRLTMVVPQTTCSR